MFTTALNDLMYHLRPARPGQLIDRTAFGEADGQSVSDWQRAAEKALNRPFPTAMVSDGLSGDGAFPAAREECRRQLFALLLSGCAEGFDRYLPRMADLVWEICGEASWREPLDEYGEPEADAFALATAELLAWTYTLAGEAFTGAASIVTRRLQRELARRLLAPFAQREAPAWAQRRGGWTLSNLISVLAVFLLADENDGRRWAGVRRALLLIDERVRPLPRDGAHPAGLEGWIQDVPALSDAATLLLTCTGGHVDVGGGAWFQRTAEYPVASHMGNGYFVNPEGEAQPRLDGRAMYRVGVCAGNEGLCRLGAFLNDDEANSPVTPTAAFLNALMARTFKAQAALPVTRERVLLPDSMRTAASVGPFRAALTGGSLSGDHIDAGNLYLFLNGQPILTDLTPARPLADAHALPAIGGIGPVRGTGGARDLDARFSDDFVCLSVNLAPAFPDNLGVQSWQRSVILSPSEQQVRIIESFDLLRPAGPVSFHFMTPKRPERLSDRALRLGDAVFRWEDDMDATYAAVPGGWRVSLTIPPTQHVSRAFIVSE